MIRRPPRPTRTYTSFPTRRSSDLVVGEEVCTQSLLVQRIRIKQASLDIQSHAARRIGDLLAAAVAERDRQVQGGVVARRPFRMADQLGYVGGQPGTVADDSQTDVVLLELGHLAAQVEAQQRSEEHTSELQSLMRISYAVFCLK